MDTLYRIINVLNEFLGKALPWVGAAALLYLNAFMFLKWLNNNIKQQKARGERTGGRSWLTALGRAFYFLVVLMLAQLAILALFHYSTYWWARWIEFFIFISMPVYFLTHKKSGVRGFFTSLGHLIVIFFGWAFGSWLGIIFISIPVLAILYYWLYRLARVILPAANPDDARETARRFQMLAWFIWGLQFPAWAVDDPQGRIAGERIPGDYFKSFGGPGMIWTRPYQVVGITNGPQFSRVDGPGVIYTGPYERPYEVLDLRVQLRSSKIQAVSADGILFNAILLVVFSLDKEPWSDNEYKALRVKNPILRGSQAPDRVSGNYRFSRGRVTSALSIEGVKRYYDNPDHPHIYWDHWVIMLAEEAARKELSKRSLNELWRPTDDKKGANALDAIANNIKNSITGIIKENGIQLIAARIVNFEFDSEKAQEIQERQIRTWESRMDQEIKKMEAEARARTVRIKESAMAYARYKFLSAVAKGLEEVSDQHRDLPLKHVIAMHFFGALREGLAGEGADGESAEKLSKIYKRFRGYPPLTEEKG